MTRTAACGGLLLIVSAAIAGCGSAETAPSGEFTVAVVQAPERGSPGFALADPVLLRVVDGDGIAREGIEVAFEASDGGLVEPARATSGLDGLVTVQWTLGVFSGPEQELAATIGAGIAARFRVATETFRVTAIDAGWGRGCGISGGEAWCWGVHALSWVGGSVLPFRAMPGLQVSAIALSDDVVCALDTLGAAWCRLPYIADTSPILVNGLPALSSIAAGDSRFCGLAAQDRTPWCWRPLSSIPPEQVAQIALTRVTPGEGFTCGLDDGGAAWCWGNGSAGQLGRGDTTSSDVPVPVAGALRFQDLSSGNGATCGVVDRVQVYCWGTASWLASPQWQSLEPAPTRMQGMQVSVGYRGSLVNGTGQTWQWGGSESAWFPVPTVLQSVQELSRLSFAAISADDSMCGMAADGTAWCTREVFGGSWLDPGDKWVPVPAANAELAAVATPGQQVAKGSR